MYLRNPIEVAAKNQHSKLKWKVYLNDLPFAVKFSLPSQNYRNTLLADTFFP